MSPRSSIKVVVRIRPPNEDELNAKTVVQASSDRNQITTLKGHGQAQQRITYNFDKIYTASATQRTVFDSALRPVIKDVLFGYESTVFAYGQTGTGKTYTMEGNLNSSGTYGIIPRSAEYIFNSLENNPDYVSHYVGISCLEIYNEELRDLLSNKENISPPQSPIKGAKLMIMEGEDGVFCKGLNEISVDSAEDMLSVLKTAQKHRQVGETKLNLKSSRSHCIFTIHVRSQKRLSDGKIFDARGKLHLVDLAGSECAKAATLDEKKDEKNEKKNISSSYNMNDKNKEMERERGNINRSLLTLGRVILMLNQRSNKKNVRIPYRDSKLTRMLKDSLGGRCLTLVIATLSPSEKAIDETISTLNYAQSASGITNKPVPVSFMKSPEKFNFCMNGEIREMKGIQHWYEMEMKMTFLQAQLDDAQAELAKQYDGQREIINRAERAEEDIITVKEVLKNTQGHLERSVMMLKHSEEIISEQQNQLESLQKEYLHMKQYFVNDVLRGVANIVNKQMGVLSSKQNETLQTMEDNNDAFKCSTKEIRSSSIDILSKVGETNQSILEHSKEKRVSDGKMALGTKLTNGAMQELDKMWSGQRKLVDDFVIQTTRKVDSMTNYEVNLASIRSKMKKECNVNSTFEDAQSVLNCNIANLSNHVSKQNHYIQKSALESAYMQLGQMKTDHSNTTEQFSTVTADLKQTFSEDKENLIKIAEKQCAFADDMRTNIESKHDEYGSILAQQMRSNINSRKDDLLKTQQEFHDLSNKTIGALTDKDSLDAKGDIDNFSAMTLCNWNAVPPLSDRESFAYRKELSSTPSDNIILERFS